MDDLADWFSKSISSILRASEPFFRSTSCSSLTRYAHAGLEGEGGHTTQLVGKESHISTLWHRMPHKYTYTSSASTAREEEKDRQGVDGVHRAACNGEQEQRVPFLGTDGCALTDHPGARAVRLLEQTERLQRKASEQRPHEAECASEADDEGAARTP